MLLEATTLLVGSSAVRPSASCTYLATLAADFSDSILGPIIYPSTRLNDSAAVEPDTWCSRLRVIASGSGGPAAALLVGIGHQCCCSSDVLTANAASVASVAKSLTRWALQNMHNHSQEWRKKVATQKQQYLHTSWMLHCYTAQKYCEAREQQHL